MLKLLLNYVPSAATIDRFCLQSSSVTAYKFRSIHTLRMFIGRWLDTYYRNVDTIHSVSSVLISVSNHLHFELTWKNGVHQEMQWKLFINNEKLSVGKRKNTTKIEKWYQQRRKNRERWVFYPYFSFSLIQIRLTTKKIGIKARLRQCI